MNRIFRKCSNFGLIVRLDSLTPDIAFKICQKLILGNVPLVTIDVSKKENIKVLNRVAFDLDLFIAAEGVDSLDSAYNAAGNGAQFFILDRPDLELITALRNSGFFFLVKVDSQEDIQKASEYGIEAIVIKNKELIGKSNLPYVLDSPNTLSDSFTQNSIFSIVNIPQVDDHEIWINRVVREYLGHEFITIEVSSTANDDERSFAKLFSSLNKVQYIEGNKNSITMECNNLTQTVNNLKWRGYYIDPNDSVIAEKRIIKGPLDTKLNGFTIVLKEKK